MREYISALRLFNRDVRLFLIASAVHGFVFFGIYSLLLNLYLLRLGYGPEFIGLTNAAGPLALAISSLPAGVYSRRYGSRHGLIVGYLFIMIGLGLLPFGQFLPGELQDAWILSTYVLAWLIGALIVVNFSPYLMGSTSPRERSHAFAIQTAVLPLFGFAGNLVGGLLPGFFAAFLAVDSTDATPYQISLLVAAALLFFAVLAMWKTHEVEVEPADVVDSGEKNTSLPLALIGVISLVWLLRTGSEWTMRIFFNVYLDSELGASTALIGLLLASGQLLGLTALFAPYAIRWLGRERTIIWMLAAMAFAYVPLLFFAHWLAVGIAFVAMIAVVSIQAPVYGLFSQELVLPRWRTTIASSMSLALGIGIALVGFGGGFVIVVAGYETLFLLAALLSVAATLIFGVYFRKPRGELSERTAADPDRPSGVQPGA